MNRLLLLPALLTISAWGHGEEVPLSYPSPDGEWKAVVVPLGREVGATKVENQSEQGTPLEYECRVEVYTRRGRKVWEQDFSSPDHDHGRGVAFARWSPDSSYFVFSTVSSGGHHPWQFFTYVYSAGGSGLHLLDSLVGAVVRQKFTMAAPNRLTLSVYDPAAKVAPKAWPGAKTVTVKLEELLRGRKVDPEDKLRHPPLSTP